MNNADEKIERMNRISEQVFKNDRELATLGSSETDNSARAWLTRDNRRLKDDYRAVSGRPWRDI